MIFLLCMYLQLRLLQETFKGQVLHSAQHKRASDYTTGKKVVVIGTGSSGMVLLCFCDLE